MRKIFSHYLDRIFWLNCKIVLIDNHYKSICAPVRSECSSCRVIMQLKFTCNSDWNNITQISTNSLTHVIFWKPHRRWKTELILCWNRYIFWEIQLWKRKQKIYYVSENIKKMVICRKTVEWLAWNFPQIDKSNRCIIPVICAFLQLARHSKLCRVG